MQSTHTQQLSQTPHNDKLLYPIKSNVELLPEVIKNVLKFCDGRKLKKKIGKMVITNQHPPL